MSHNQKIGEDRVLDIVPICERCKQVSRAIFSRKHYEAIAQVIYRVDRGYYSNSTSIDLRNDLATFFLKDNPEFSPSGFFNRCEGKTDASK